MRIIVIVAFLVLVGCQNESDVQSTQFTRIDSNHSGIDFSNNLDEKNLKSVFNYINAYTGGGVAIGDVNNDGLQDVYLTGNMVSSKLYLNQGDFKFEDITDKAGVSTNGWSTAVSMADVNNDGWLDIYVCRSYHDQIDMRKNLLFINNQDGTFTESAESLGLADSNYGIASSFFDYDRDGDLDVFVGNHPRYRAVSLQTHYNYWLNPVDHFSNHLYRNDGGTFTKVTKEAGLMTYGFTLALNTADFDLDGWPDIFISVDHDEPDRIFKNNGDGTFTNVTYETVNQTSLSSMGVDAGDVNHDKYPDLFVAEMLTEDHYREKVNMSMSNVKRFEYFVDSLNYNYYQMHNFLHLNNGNGTFSDVAQLAGIHKSDWSWATLFIDMDHDGWQDLYVTNGLYKEVFNRDRKNKLDSVMISLNGDMAKMNQIANEYSLNAPQTKVPNYLFKSKGNLKFEKFSKQAGLDDETISTGAAYGDLDNDGDLDIVVNNLGQESFVYRNNQNSDNYIRIGFNKNGPTPVGTKVFLYNGDDVQSRQLLLNRGFQSSCEPFVHFGISDNNAADKIEIIWPDGKMQVLSNVAKGSQITANYEDATKEFVLEESPKIFNDLDPKVTGLDYEQKENYYFDYDDQVLLPHRMSEYGPIITQGDVNNDSRIDLVIGSPTGQASALFIQNSDGSFSQKMVQAFENDKTYEDAQPHVFDANGDGNMDIVIGSTGYQFEENSEMYLVRLYLGDGAGNFRKSSEAFGGFSQSISVAVSQDVDGDGDLDLFLGGRDRPKKYPQPPVSTLWVNNGKGEFEDKTQELAPEFLEMGMVRDAIWTDLNGDENNDLLVVGEWMNIHFMINEGGKFSNKSEGMIAENPSGWFNSITKADIDGNGLDDYILGNLGLNYKYKASKEKPFVVYSEDFDKSGSCDIVLGTYYGDVMYPVRGKNCSSEQIPDLEKKFPTYEEYAHADIIDVYGDALDKALNYEVTDFKSMILYQDEQGKYSTQPLPFEAQRSPINASVAVDVNKDGKLDIIAVGNLYQSEIETGRADAGIGSVLINKGDRSFESLPTTKSGLFANGDTKSMVMIESEDSKQLIIGKNRGKIQAIAFE